MIWKLMVVERATNPAEISLQQVSCQRGCQFFDAATPHSRALHQSERLGVKSQMDRS